VSGELVAALQQTRPAGPQVGFAMATVTTASPLTITLDIATTATAARRLASYTPVAGHRVAVLIIDQVDRLVLGQVL
jgi:hypothetical protein